MNALRVLGLVALACSMAGCGSQGPRAEVRLGGGAQTTPTTPKDTVVAALGDSITAGSPSWDPDEGVRTRIGEEALDPESQFEYWAKLRHPDLSFRNCGVFGERTDQIAERLEHCADGAQVLVLQGGINDIAQLRRVAVAARNLRAMAVKGRSLGLRVVLTEVIPWNNGYPGADHRIRALNRRIGRIGRELDVPVAPWYRRLEDPRRPGRMPPEWTADGDHPSVEGYRRLAQDLQLP